MTERPTATNAQRAHLNQWRATQTENVADSLNIC